MSRFTLFIALFIVSALVACSPSATPTATPASSPTETPPPPQPSLAPSAAPTMTSAPQEKTTAPSEEEAYPAFEAYPEKTAPETMPLTPYPGMEQAPPSTGGAWVIDGNIEAGEYTGKLVLGPVAIFWAHNGTDLYLAAETQTEGWLGIGLDPEDRMQGADFIIAAWDGEPKIWDAYGQGPIGATHPPDTELGGTMDILEYAVVKDGPFFRFEALRPLNSGDAFDKPLEPGETYKLIVAVGVSPAFDARHAYRGQGEITLE